jgi:hypothetical protein
MQHFQSFLLDKEQELLGRGRHNAQISTPCARHAYLAKMTQTACQSPACQIFCSLEKFATSPQAESADWA